jgi:hypothetical protein
MLLLLQTYSLIFLLNILYELCEVALVKFIGRNLLLTCTLIISTTSIWEFLFSFEEEFEIYHKSLHVCTVHRPSPPCTAHPHNRLICCRDIDHVMNDEDIES